MSSENELRGRIGTLEGKLMEALFDLAQARAKLGQTWLIWSNEHRAWWGPGSRGYEVVLSKAGRYSRERAAEICAGANRYLSEGSEPNEVMVLAPAPAEALHHEG